MDYCVYRRGRVVYHGDSAEDAKKAIDGNPLETKEALLGSGIKATAFTDTDGSWLISVLVSEHVMRHTITEAGMAVQFDIDLSGVSELMSLCLFIKERA